MWGEFVGTHKGCAIHAWTGIRKLLQYQRASCYHLNKILNDYDEEINKVCAIKKCNSVRILLEEDSSSARLMLWEQKPQNKCLQSASLFQVEPKDVQLGFSSQCLDHTVNKTSLLVPLFHILLLFSGQIFETIFRKSFWFCVFITIVKHMLNTDSHRSFFSKTSIR